MIRSRRNPVPAERRDRRPVRQPRPGRRDHQAGRGVAAPAAAPRPGGRLRLGRGPARAHRLPRPRCRRRQRAGAARLRPARLPGHAGGGEPAAADQAAPARGPGHGAGVRRADERHRLRHGRAARRPRSGCRRPARQGSAPATGSASTSSSGASRSRCPTTNLTPGSPRRPWPQLSPARPGAGRSSTSTTSSAPTPARTWTSSSAPAATSVARDSHYRAGTSSQEAAVITICALTSAATLAWLYLLTLHGGYWRTGHRLPPGGRGSGHLPSVTAVVPARNEADILPACLPTLLSQDYQGRFSVIVVDDDSADDTAKVAAELGAAVVSARPTPPGWAGKVWAMAEGAQAVERGYRLHPVHRRRHRLRARHARPGWPARRRTASTRWCRRWRCCAPGTGRRSC